MMHHEMMEQIHMMGPLMWIAMILLWGFIIFGLVSLIRWIITRFWRQDENRHGSP